MTTRSYHAIRDDLADLLAKNAGVDRTSRVFGNYVSQAIGMLRQFDYRAPDDETAATPIGKLCAEWHSVKQEAVAARKITDALRAANLADRIAKRDAESTAPEGFLFLHLRDEIDGKLYRLTLPAESVQQVAR